MNHKIETPDWVKHAIFYQIFPDRFRRGSKVSPPPGTYFKPWGAPPEEQGFQGGDLYGVIDSLDYLQSLGVNAIYLNPIFSSAANHRYHTFDYYQVDPLLGGNEALQALLTEAHQRDMRIVLDGVFNHASRGFWPFHHILENGGDSPYIDWFIVHDWPLQPYPNKGEEINYAAWWNLPALPKLNTDNPAVQEYILDIAKHWIDFGIDGWRLDVPQEIDNPAFWRRFRNVVKSANPEAYICGEIWEEAKAWLKGDQFDAVMNYTVAWGSMTYCGFESLHPTYQREHFSLKPRSAEEVADVLNEMYAWYDWEINYAQLNLLDSHDTARALWVLGEDKNAFRLAVLMLMTLPGAPCIYYGDEIGMSAGDDPFCREAFPWENEQAWDHTLLDFYRAVCELRNTHSMLRIGDFEIVLAEGRVLGYRRGDESGDAIIVFNAGFDDIDKTLDRSLFRAGSDMLKIAWSSEGVQLDVSAPADVMLSLPPQSACVLLAPKA